MSRPRALNPEQAAMVLAVLRFNHDYYTRQGMSPAHMHPDEVAAEICNALRHNIAPVPMPNPDDDAGYWEQPR